MKFLPRRFSSINRYFLFVGIGFAVAVLVLLVMGIAMPGQVFGPGWVENFYQGLLTTVVFFGLVGVAAFVQQIYSARGDVLRKRIEYLFGARSVSTALIDFIERVVRRNALYSTGTLHEVEVHEYRPDLKAYRVSMVNSYELRNALGDLVLDEVMPFNFVPDVARHSIKPLAELVSLTTSENGREIEHVKQHESIPADGLQKIVRVRAAPRDVVHVRSEHWTWASNSESSGFSIRRFSERTRVIVRNKSNVTVQIYRTEASEDPVSLSYGEEAQVRDRVNVQEMTRLGFSWLPPVEFPEAAPSERTDTHPLLTARDEY
jgi:hypothetical protein